MNLRVVLAGRCRNDREKSACSTLCRTEVISDRGGATKHDRLHSTLRSPRRVALLLALIERPSLTVNELASHAGLHPNTTREHLERLVEAGLVSRRSERRQSRGRPRTLYSAGARDAPADFAGEQHVRQARVLGERFRSSFPEKNAAPIAMRDQADVLEHHLERCGFSPILDASRGRIELSCPFVAFSADEKTMMRTVGAALATEALRRVDGPIGDVKITPGRQGDCVLTFLRRRNDEGDLSGQTPPAQAP